MSPKRRSIISAFTAALVVLGVAVFAVGQSDPVGVKSNARQQPTASPSPARRREENKKPADATRYSYEFTKAEFDVHHIVIEHDAMGHGKVTFERQGATDPIVEPVDLSTAALGRIMGLWSQLNFLDSSEEYQSSKQFPQLGTMRIHMENGDRKRTAEFNWTNNKQTASLVNEYRRVADQAIFLFDVAVARENQPLNAPKLMDYAETLISSGGLSDPYQIVPLLRDISTDERLPLIARNHASRLIKRIEK
jgi:hypothetical protein